MIEGCLTLIVLVHRPVEDIDEQIPVDDDLDLVITSTWEGRTVAVRPVSSAQALTSALQRRPRPTRLGLDNIIAVYQESTEWLFRDRSARFDLNPTTALLIAPSINMVEVRDIHDESLVAMLKEAPTDTDL